MTDAEMLKKFRTDFGLTQQQAAEIIGLADGRRVRRVENGEVQRGKVARLSEPTRRALEYYRKWQGALSK